MTDKMLKNTQTALTRLENAQLVLEQKQEAFAKYLDEIKEQEEKVKNLKEELYACMKEADVKNLETDFFRVTAVWETTKHAFDMKKLQAMNPMLWEQVNQAVGYDSPVKGYVKIATRTKGAK